MRFTEQEFYEMVQELLYSEPISYKMLCLIAEKTLKPSVLNWSRTDECLRQRGYGEDLMNEIHLRLIKTVIPYFLLRDDIDGDYNNDPEGFEDWMFSVAYNVKRDIVKKFRKHDFNIDNSDDVSLCDIPAQEDEDNSEEHIERLKQAFSIAISANVGIYKTLTWIAQFIFILEADVTKIKSNDLLLEAFENKTLYDMYDMIQNASKKIPWIVITSEQDEKIVTALRKKRDGEVTYGECKFKSFFMKQNGIPSGKKSISDWVNRMNDIIKREMGKDNDGNKNAKKKPSEETANKLSDNDNTAEKLTENKVGEKGSRHDETSNS